MPLIGVLAVQGAFIEHERHLERLGARCRELRCRDDCLDGFDGLVLPGGESTVQSALLQRLEMFEPLRDAIVSGVPVMGTCAGLILLADKVEGGDPCFGTLPAVVERNAYGRQLASFRTESSWDGGASIPLTFIRAPKIAFVESGVSVLACAERDIAAVRWRNQLGVAFHPELDEDCRVHGYFLDMIG